MSDMIDRQDAIDAVNAYLGLSAVSRTIQNMTSIQDILEKLPPAEPVTHEERTETHACDLISRQDAVKTMYDLCEDIDDESLHIDVIVDALENLQSAEPEIIRCRDCKYASPNGVYGCRLERFSVHDENIRLFADDYCSAAER